MLNDKYYKLLTYIKSSPNFAVSKEVLYNSKKFIPDDIDILLIELEKEELINIYNHDGIDHYRASHKGDLFIKNYKNNFRKTIFDKYAFPIITSAISLILSLIIGSMMK